MNAQRYVGQIAVLAAALLTLLPACAQEREPAAATFGRPHITAVVGAVTIIEQGKVIHFGRTIYKGSIDINPTLKRIREGVRMDHVNDGSHFRNIEGLLPRKRDREYYREFLHGTKGMPFPGPQRVVIGKEGEVYYTGDHYDSFTRVR